MFRRSLPAALLWWITSQCTSRMPEPIGSPKFSTFLFTHATLFVDPGRPSKNSPNRSLCVGFWAVETIAICVSHIGAVSSFRKYGLPCGLRDSLCTLQLSCSVFVPPQQLQHSVRLTG